MFDVTSRCDSTDDVSELDNTELKDCPEYDSDVPEAELVDNVIGVDERVLDSVEETYDVFE